DRELARRLQHPQTPLCTWLSAAGAAGDPTTGKLDFARCQCNIDSLTPPGTKNRSAQNGKSSQCILNIPWFGTLPSPAGGPEMPRFPQIAHEFKDLIVELSRATDRN